MSRRNSFIWKIVYIVAICILLGGLVFSSNDLTRRRKQHGLSQTELGQIDPTSEAIKLASFGMRGVAANILWGKANRYQMKKDWTNLSATLEQITRVQPNFISVWKFQAWNLSYNVSVQFDDFRQRYHWVIRGLEFLKKGIDYNEREPLLYSEVGRFTSQKIGRADEHKQFRRLFKEDNDYHGSRPVGLRDNWLVGKEWYLKAERLLETAGISMKGRSPLMIYSDAPMCQMYYAEGLEKDGFFGETAKLEWIKASKEWSDYGNRQIATTFEDVPFIRLGDQEALEEEVRGLFDQLEPLMATQREQLKQEKLAQLTDEQREVLEIPSSERSSAQQKLAEEAEGQIEVDPEEIARRLEGDERAQAVKLIKQMALKNREIKVISQYYREPVNFEYWKLRSEVEQNDVTLSARKSIYQANQAFADADLGLARKFYDEGFKAWREVLDKYPQLLGQPTFISDLGDVIKVYRRLLDLREEDFPTPFILEDVVERTKDNF